MFKYWCPSMPTQYIADTECTLTLQRHGHEASIMHNGLVNLGR